LNGQTAKGAGMTDKNANNHSKDGQDRWRPESEPARISGDPGVGGLLADPQEAVSKVTRHPKTNPGPATPDPELPRAHGDWAPTVHGHGQSDNTTKPGDRITGN
jgi:hypothetical protein